MRRYWIDYHPEFVYGPMTYWTHRLVDETRGEDRDAYDPPLPDPVPGEGFALYHVEVDGMTFRFSSLAELDLCIATLGRKLLPCNARESRERTGYISNHHWLSRLPNFVRRWRWRAKAVPVLARARDAFAA